MAYQNIRTSFVNKNGVPYNLQYDVKTGNVQIIQQNAPAGTKPIYQDGKWNTSATTLGFSDSEKKQLHTEVIVAVQGAYKNVGGVSSGAILAQWASENFTNGSPGQSSVNPQNAVSGNVGGVGGRSTIAGGGTGTVGGASKTSATTGTQQTGTGGGGTSAVGAGGGVGSLFGFLQNPAEEYKNFAVNGSKFGVPNEKELFSGEMKYPIDMMTSQQDHFAISQFRYKPSKADAIFGGTASAVQTLTSGLQLGSNLSTIIGTVFLPMPNSIADSNNVSWGDDAMGNIAAALAAQTMGTLKESALTAFGGAALGSLAGVGGQKGAQAGLLIKNLDALIKSGAVGPELTTLLGTDFVSRLLKLQGMGVEPESILARGAGIIPNSNLELLFNAPTLRSFTFSYRLSPRSAEEAQKVRRIIRFFKQGMAVKKMSGKSGEASYFLGTPNVFKLEFRSGKTKSIDGVNKFKTCALTSFSCNYTPDGLWAAYDKGQPVSTTMQMSFNELEPIYDTDYQEGQIFGGRDDLSSVSANSVGY